MGIELDYPSMPLIGPAWPRDLFTGLWLADQWSCPCHYEASDRCHLMRFAHLSSAPWHRVVNHPNELTTTLTKIKLSLVTANKLKLDRKCDNSLRVTIRVGWRVITSCSKGRGWLPVKRKILEAVGIKNIFHSNLETDNEASNEILWSCKYQIGP